MELFLPREPSTELSTISRLYINGLFECFVLEDPVREVPGQSVESWKIPGITAIPAGRYRITLFDSPKFGPETILLHDVRGFSFVEMHGGNRATDTDGCLIVGDKIGEDWIGGAALDGILEALKRKIFVEIGRGEEVWITITNP